MAITRDHRTNNFDFIRLFAATMVIFSHSFSMDDIPAPIIANDLDLGILGVCIFFIISGFLVSQSFIRNPSLKSFFASRVLRIYPGLIGVVLFSMFIIGPIFTSLRVKAYLTNPETYKYFFNLTLYKLHEFLPGVFVNKLLVETVNAPLWTLVFEFAMYIIVAVYGVLGLLRKTPLGITFNILALCFFTYVFIFHSAAPYYFLGFSKSVFSRFYICFFGGALFGFYIDKIKFNLLIFLPLIVLFATTIKTPLADLTILPLLGYSIFYVAYLPKPIGRFITGKGDFSYGLYLYGYIVQNCIHHLIPHLPVWEMFTLAMLFTAPLAVASWFLIEKKSLELKKYFLKRWSGGNALILKNEGRESTSVN